MRDTSSTDSDFALAFLKTAKKRDDCIKSLIKSCKGDSLLWMCYPKKSSKNYKCDLSRDSGWDFLGEGGFEPVRSVSIDDDWSALRFRRVEFIKVMKRSALGAISREGKRKAIGLNP